MDVLRSLFCGLFYYAVNMETTYYQMIGLMNDLERIWKEMVMAYLRYYLKICLEGLKNTRRLSQYSWYPSLICTKYFLSIILEHYHYTSLLDASGYIWSAYKEV
jgi:hypothetical protein